MTIEEKAKAYDEAKLRISSAYNSNRCTIGFMNEIFPELKESEDERIRKTISDILLIDSDEIRKILVDNNILMQDIDAWLEKQGDIIENNMLLPFKEYDNLMDSINKKKKEGYEAGYKQGLIDSKNDQHVQPKFKVGDTIRVKNSSAEYVITDIYGGCYHGKGWGLDIISADRSGDYELVEQKPTAWSEEDENLLKTIFDSLNTYAKNGHSCLKRVVKDEIAWLKSIKDRVQPQPKQEWGEEDNYILKNIYDFVAENLLDKNRCACADECLKWLKSLKYRVGCEVNCTTTKEWSEEDEKMSKGILNYLCLSDACELDGFDRWYNWLKSSLKDKVQSLSRPKNTWEPSDEQIKAVEDAIGFLSCTEKVREDLKSLYEQLKKLKG